jgi:hypothetical protein
MANTNVQAIAFSNTRIRPMADLLSCAYHSAKKLVNEWNAQGVATVIPNDATVISDGAATDGRAPITDAQATAIVTRCNELISWMEQGLVATPFLVPVTNATLNTVSLVQVNGQAKF